MAEVQRTFPSRLVEAVKGKLSPDLDDVAVHRITLHTAEDGPALRPGLTLSAISSQSSHTDEPTLIVKILELQKQQQLRS
jgi:hypothetical protein